MTPEPDSPSARLARLGFIHARDPHNNPTQMKHRIIHAESGAVVASLDCYEAARLCDWLESRP